MTKVINFIVKASNRKEARKRTWEMYRTKRDLKIITINPSKKYGGYQVWVSFEVPDHPL